MQTILTSNQSTLIVDKSRFIGVTFHVETTHDVNECLAHVRKIFPKAKHYCYAYVIGHDEKGFDDGEPSKTAGRPLLELLKRGAYDETLIVVVRYFGGTLLGASRLLRTYVSIANATLNAAEKHQIVYMHTYQLEVSYSDYEYLQNEAKKHSFILENVTFSDTIGIKLLAQRKADEILLQILQGRGIIKPLNLEKRYLKENSL